MATYRDYRGIVLPVNLGYDFLHNNLLSFFEDTLPFNVDFMFYFDGIPGDSVYIHHRQYNNHGIDFSKFNSLSFLEASDMTLQLVLYPEIDPHYNQYYFHPDCPASSLHDNPPGLEEYFNDCILFTYSSSPKTYLSKLVNIGGWKTGWSKETEILVTGTLSFTNNGISLYNFCKDDYFFDYSFSDVRYSESSFSFDINLSSSFPVSNYDLQVFNISDNNSIVTTLVDQYFSNDLNSFDLFDSISTLTFDFTYFYYLNKYLFKFTLRDDFCFSQTIYFDYTHSFSLSNIPFYDFSLYNFFCLDSSIVNKSPGYVSSFLKYIKSNLINSSFSLELIKDSNYTYLRDSFSLQLEHYSFSYPNSYSFKFSISDYIFNTPNFIDDTIINTDFTKYFSFNITSLYLIFNIDYSDIHLNNYIFEFHSDDYVYSVKLSYFNNFFEFTRVNFSDNFDITLFSDNFDIDFFVRELYFIIYDFSIFSFSTENTYLNQSISFSDCSNLLSKFYDFSFEDYLYRLTYKSCFDCSNFSLTSYTSLTSEYDGNFFNSCFFGFRWNYFSKLPFNFLKTRMDYLFDFYSKTDTYLDLSFDYSYSHDGYLDKYIITYFRSNKSNFDMVLKYNDFDYITVDSIVLSFNRSSYFITISFYHNLSIESHKVFIYPSETLNKYIIDVASVQNSIFTSDEFHFYFISSFLNVIPFDCVNCDYSSFSDSTVNSFFLNPYNHPLLDSSHSQLSSIQDRDNLFYLSSDSNIFDSHHIVSYYDCFSLYGYDLSDETYITDYMVHSLYSHFFDFDFIILDDSGNLDTVSASFKFSFLTSTLNILFKHSDGTRSFYKLSDISKSNSTIKLVRYLDDSDSYVFYNFYFYANYDNFLSTDSSSEFTLFISCSDNNIYNNPYSYSQDFSSTNLVSHYTYNSYDCFPNIYDDLPIDCIHYSNDGECLECIPLSTVEVEVTEQLISETEKLITKTTTVITINCNGTTDEEVYTETETVEYSEPCNSNTVVTESIHNIEYFHTEYVFTIKVHTLITDCNGTTEIIKYVTERYSLHPPGGYLDIPKDDPIIDDSLDIIETCLNDCISNNSVCQNDIRFDTYVSPLGFRHSVAEDVYINRPSSILSYDLYYTYIKPSVDEVWLYRSRQTSSTNRTLELFYIYPSTDSKYYQFVIEDYGYSGLSASKLVYKKAVNGQYINEPGNTVVTFYNSLRRPIYSYTENSDQTVYIYYDYSLNIYTVYNYYKSSKMMNVQVKDFSHNLKYTTSHYYNGVIKFSQGDFNIYINPDNSFMPFNKELTSMILGEFPTNINTGNYSLFAPYVVFDTVNSSGDILDRMTIDKNYTVYKPYESKYNNLL